MNLTAILDKAKQDAGYSEIAGIVKRLRGISRYLRLLNLNASADRLDSEIAALEELNI